MTVRIGMKDADELLKRVREFYSMDRIFYHRLM